MVYMDPHLKDIIGVCAIYSETIVNNVERASDSRVELKQGGRLVRIFCYR